MPPQPNSRVWDGDMLHMLPFLRQVTWPHAPDDTHARIQYDTHSKILLLPTAERTETVNLGDTVVIENGGFRIVRTAQSSGE
jgi:hypothetical protein